MARPKKYSISLTDEQLKELKSVIRKKQTSKTVRSRYQIIIDLDEEHGKWRDKGAAADEAGKRPES